MDAGDYMSSYSSKYCPELEKLNRYSIKGSIKLDFINFCKNLSNFI